MNANAMQQENKMGVMPVNRLLVSISLPIMISMLVQALYNVVDSMFVAQVSENALTAVSLAFPAQNLMIAVATGTGVGVNALLSKSLGEKNYDQANRTANHAVLLACCNYAVFAILGMAFSRRFFEAQTQVAEIIAYGTSYLRVCTLFSFGIFIQITFERLLQSTGKTMYSMFTQGLGAIINIILDPILIFGWLGLPALGVAGAAIATVIGQISAGVLGWFLNQRKNHEIQLSIKGFRPEGHIIGKIYKVGIPSIIMASIGSVMTFGMNKILILFSTTATAVFGVYFKLQSFVFMPVYGLNNGLVPIISYNYGAKKPKRIIQAIRLSILYAVSIMLVGLVVFQLCTERLLSFFNASEHMMSIGTVALRVISLHFIIAGFSVICSSVFQSLSHGLLSLSSSLLRQLVVLLPVAFWIARIGVLDYVWWAFPIAEVFSALSCALFLRYVYQKEIRPLGLREEEKQDVCAQGDSTARA